jgi:hypothetical protein
MTCRTRVAVVAELAAMIRVELNRVATAAGCGFSMSRFGLNVYFSRSRSTDASVFGLHLPHCVFAACADLPHSKSVHFSPKYERHNPGASLRSFA